jgi:SAM-dependent methyltransferase
MPRYQILTLVFLLCSQAAHGMCAKYLSGFIDHESEEVFLDINTAYESWTVHVTGARQFPLSMLTKALDVDFESAAWKKKVAGKHVLSIGEGYSPLLPKLKSQGAFVVGGDIWFGRGPFPDSRGGREMTQYTRDHARSLVAADARQMPFRDESFDVIVSTFLLGHIQEPSQVEFFKEIGRSLKPGGFSLVTLFAYQDDQEEISKVYFEQALDTSVFKLEMKRLMIEVPDLRQDDGSTIEAPVILMTITRRN